MATHEEIFNLIPHRPPIIMISKMILAEEDQFISAFHIKKGNVFLKNGYFEEAGLIENMAQTALAGFSVLNQNDYVPKALLAAVEELKIYALPIEGNILTTTITPLYQAINMMSVAGKVTYQGRLLSEGTLKFFTLNNEV